MFNTARWRFTLIFTLVLGIVLVASFIVVYLTAESLMYDRVDDELEARANRDGFLFTRVPPASLRDGLFAGAEFDPNGFFFAVVDAQGEIVGSPPYLDSEALAPVAVLEHALDADEAFADTESSQGDSQRVYVRPLETGGDTLLVEVGRNVEPEEAALSQLRTILMVVFGVSMLPAAVGGYLLAGRTLRPIKTAMDSQRAFIADASHELRTPVAVV